MRLNGAGIAYRKAEQISRMGRSTTIIVKARNAPGSKSEKSMSTRNFTALQQSEMTPS